MLIPLWQTPGPWVQPTCATFTVTTLLSMEKCCCSNTVITGLLSDVVGNTQGARWPLPLHVLMLHSWQEPQMQPLDRLQLLLNHDCYCSLNGFSIDYYSK